MWSREAPTLIQDGVEINPIKLKDRAYNTLGITNPCFPAGTIIKTPKGNKFIEDIKINDLVYAFDTNKQERIISKVEGTYKNWTDYLVKIETDNIEIHATKNHRVWINEKSTWIEAEDLKPNMSIRLFDDNIEQILKAEISEVVCDTYNFSVEKYHNYFAGEKGLLVHNETSKFSVANKTKSTIYSLVDQGTGEVYYVGQTIQNGGDAETRIMQHIESGNFDDLFDKFNLEKNIDGIDDFFDEFVKIETPVDGLKLSSFELTVWEQHYIEKNGGIDNLLNKINAITEEKYIKYWKYHNPCGV